VRIAGPFYDFSMPRDASTTRERLLDAAAHEFAEQGVWNASLIEVTRRAGQRNRAALRYHFGNREAVLCAVLERHVEFLAHREGELLAKARRTPDDDVGAVVEAIVRPAAELAASDWRGRACLLIIAELAGEDPARFSPELESVLARTGGHEVYGLLFERMPALPQEILDERSSLITSFILRAVADRERDKERTTRPARPQVDDEAFVANLVAMVAGAVTSGWPS
jgi:AcrR family transcriptional regulator